MTAAAGSPGRPQRALTPVRAAKVAALVALLVLLPPLADSQFVTTVMISCLMFGLLGAIYDLMLGYAGLINFGFGGFLAVGAYTSALASFHFGVSPWLGLGLGGLMCALVGLVTGVITLRLKGLYLALMTFFVGEAIRFSIANSPEYTRGTLGLTVEPFPDLFGIGFGRENLLPYYYLLLLLGAAVMAVMTALVRSRYGLAFKAIREDQLAAESLAVDATRYKLVNFTIASLLTGVIGAFYAHYLGILSPTPEEFGVPRTVEVLIVTYVGGRGTLWGSLFAGFLLIGFQEYFRSLGAWRLVLFGLLLIGVMLFARKGLSGLKKYVW